jgi:hypothetical protein
MKHFAKVVNNLVVNIVVADQVPTLDKDFYIEDDGTKFNPAVVGGTYDAVRDAFIPKKPFPSWTLNETTCQWEAPVAYPADSSELKPYKWNESTKSWDEIV